MYRNCVVMHCDVKQPEEKSWQATSMEDLLTMISK